MREPPSLGGGRSNLKLRSFSRFAMSQSVMTPASLPVARIALSGVIHSDLTESSLSRLDFELVSSNAGDAPLVRFQNFIRPSRNAAISHFPSGEISAVVR